MSDMEYEAGLAEEVARLEKIVELYVDRGMSGDAVAREVGVGTDTVYRRLKLIGIERRTRSGRYYKEPGTCCICGKPWSEDAFYPSTLYRCKACKDAYTKAYREQKREEKEKA